MSETNKNPNVAKLLAQIQKDFKKNFKDSTTEIMTMAEEPPPTGILLDNPLFEFLIDSRFLIFGRCILAHGKKSSGKTSLMFFIINLFQGLNGVCYLSEPENALDRVYAKNQGVKIEEVIISHPETFEKTLTTLEDTISSLPKVFPEGDVPVLIGLDSIAANITDYEAEQTVVGDTTPGGHAKLLTAFYSKIVGPLAFEKATFFALNQEREKIGSFGFGEKPIALKGGESQFFHSTLRIAMTRTGDITEPDPHYPDIKRKVGSTHRMVCKRNKIGREGNSQAIEVDLYAEDVLDKEGNVTHNGGFDWYGSLCDFLAKNYKKLLVKGGGYFTWQIENTKFFNINSQQEEIILTDKCYLKKDMATILKNSEQAKEIMREAFGIRPLPTLEEVVKVEENNKKKRKKKVTDEPKTL
jgi:recombination protein RecA